MCNKFTTEDSYKLSLYAISMYYKSIQHLHAKYIDLSDQIPLTITTRACVYQSLNFEGTVNYVTHL